VAAGLAAAVLRVFDEHRLAVDNVDKATNEDRRGDEVNSDPAVRRALDGAARSAPRW